MSASALSYDVFISYSHDETDWVKENLYERLCRCRFKIDGRRPRIFFDRSKEGIGVGQNWPEAVATAIRHSPRVITVYSTNYFQSDVCKWELQMAHVSDLLGTRRKLNPVMFIRRGQEPATVDQLLPDAVRNINYLPITEPDWFERLCEALELVPETEQGVLEFWDQPPTVLVNHTLPSIRVVIKAKGAANILAREEVITLSAEGCTLQGPLTVKSERGTAKFVDLSIGAPMASTRLVARAEGLEPARSEPFAVEPPVTPPAPKPPQIPCPGEAIFFASGRTLAVLHDNAVRIYNLAGQSLLQAGEVPLTGRLRLVRRTGPYVVLADWSGTIYLFSEDGGFKSCAFGNTNGGFVVPAEAVIDGHQVYVGFWSGAVWRLSLWAEPVRELHHDSGVQSLAVTAGRFYVCGFDGNLWTYHGGQRVNAEMLEPAIWLLKTYPNNLMAIGDERMYHVKIAPPKVFKERLPVAGVAAVLGDGDVPVVIDAQGMGACLSADLVRVAGFHTTPGAVPIGSDLAGRHCVLMNPDGSRTLLVQGRIVFSHVGGTLAVAPAGDRFALGERSGIRILDAKAFAGLVGGEPHHA